MPGITLIADSGSTKTQWEAVDPSTQQHDTFFTRGINPYYQSQREISANIQAELLSQLNGVIPEKIIFYGAGCSTAEKCDIVRNGLLGEFETAEVIVEHDLLGAARATCGIEPGITAILGTGSNSCLYDGQMIIDNIPSLGFILGDEAGGGYFGRRLLQAHYYRELPEELETRFKNTFQLNRTEVLNKVYDQPNPNQFVASFAKFISDYNQSPFIREILEKGFREFIERHVMKYKDYKGYPVHFIGSVAFFNKNILTKTMSDLGLRIGSIEKAPMAGLLKYHFGINN